MSGFNYEYAYDADGYVTSVKYPNGIVTSIDYKPDHLVGTQKTTASEAQLRASTYNCNAREFTTDVQDHEDKSAYAYNNREQLSRIETRMGDVMLYEYDGAGNRTICKTIIQGTEDDKRNRH